MLTRVILFIILLLSIVIRWADIVCKCGLLKNWFGIFTPRYCYRVGWLARLCETLTVLWESVSCLMLPQLRNLLECRLWPLVHRLWLVFTWMKTLCGLDLLLHLRMVERVRWRHHLIHERIRVVTVVHWMRDVIGRHRMNSLWHHWISKPDLLLMIRW